jgi:diaminohydroxyphosphoribosylaminopyrimidine deaminase/5-amino-6-(5-phosphoribosylamino)uracil reductase
MPKMDHEPFMRWALALALEAEGMTSPNPMVGAVVVKDGDIVGEGYHRRSGTPHAEIHALTDAGPLARGADLYVTLEPCCHTGKTPPCVDAIADAGIRMVCVGTRDPNPIVNGRGIAALKRAGIKVHEGILEERCRAINEPYNKFISTGIPHVTLKAALSLDGKIATSSGDSKWITNSECRKFVHRLRGTSDAVMIGAGTLRTDDPRLDVRFGIKGRGAPKAIVVSELLNIPKDLNLLRRRSGGVIFATTSRAPKARASRLMAMGHDVIFCRAGRDGRVSLSHLLKTLGKRGITSVLLEGGGELFSDFVCSKLVDRVIACIAPIVIGGKGRDFLPGASISGIKSAWRLADVEIKTFGDNVVIGGRIS